VGCRERSREPCAPRQTYHVGEISQLFGSFSVGCRERSREPRAPCQAYPTRGVLPNHCDLSLLGVESEAVSLVLPTESTLRERSPNYLDHSPWGVERKAASLPYEKTTESDPAPWGVESHATSLVLPAEPTL
jgi:hypothetical protein